ncbi:MAG: hypothetical protein KatS3mg057_0702 [Herpetosiphonaceae bacterium]|nr:MAG: hypothetical protein KatS3mg057_0702 [Herpetosiphonaceae bacterium]
MKLVTAAEMRKLEQAAIAAGTPEATLMEEAGLGIALEALRRLPKPREGRVVVLVGPGNNGGDGLVAARHLHDSGAQATLYVWKRRLSEEDANWVRCAQRGIPTVLAADDQDQARLRDMLAGADLVIDGLLGAGLSRPIAGELHAIVEAVNSVRLRRQAERPLILSIDLPTGIDTDRGTVWGVAIKADVTVATGLAKRGHRLGARRRPYRRTESSFQLACLQQRRSRS